MSRAIFWPLAASGLPQGRARRGAQSRLCRKKLTPKIVPFSVSVLAVVTNNIGNPVSRVMRDASDPAFRTPHIAHHMPRVMHGVPYSQFSYIQFTQVQPEGLKSQKHCLFRPQHGLQQFKAPRGWAHLSRLSF